MIRELDEWIIDHTAQYLANALGWARINPYTVAKFILDGSFLLFIVETAIELLVDNYLYRAIDLFCAALYFYWILSQRSLMSQDERRYERGNYLPSNSRVNNLFMRLFLVVVFIWLLTDITKWIDLLMIIQYGFLILAFLLWAAIPIPPSPNLSRLAYSGA